MNNHLSRIPLRIRQFISMLLCLCLLAGFLPQQAEAASGVRSITRVLVDDHDLYLALILRGKEVAIDGNAIVMAPGDSLEIDCYSKNDDHSYLVMCGGEEQLNRIAANDRSRPNDHRQNSFAIRSIPDSDDPNPYLRYDPHADSYCYYYQAERTGSCTFRLEGYSFYKGVVNGSPTSSYCQLYHLTITDQPVSSDPYLSVDAGHKEGLTADPSGGRGMNVRIFSNTDWKLRVVEGAEWISLSQTAGSGNGQFHTMIAGNTAGKREGLIELSAPDCETIKIRVTQGAAGYAQLLGSPYLTVDAGLDSGLSAKAAGGRGMNIRVFSDTKWTLRVTEGESWITPSCSSGNGEGTFYIKTKENTGSKREGRIELSAAGCETLSIRVVQAGSSQTAKPTQKPAPHSCKDQNGNHQCDLCGKWQKLSYACSNHTPDTFLFMNMLETGLIDRMYTLWYSQYVQKLEAAASLSVAELADLCRIDRLTELFQDREVQNRVIARLFINYVSSIDVEQSLAYLTDDEMTLILRKIDEYLPGVLAIRTGVSALETVNKLSPHMTDVDTFLKSLLVAEHSSNALLEFAKSANLSVALKISTEVLEKVIDEAKAQVVVQRIRRGIGGFENLPVEIRDEVEIVLAEMQSHLVLFQEIGTAAADGFISTVLKNALISCPLLKTAQASLSIYTGVTDYDQLGAGIEELIVVKAKTEAAHKALSKAITEYNQHPDSERFDMVMERVCIYQMFATLGIVSYRDWSLMEANDRFDFDFWNHEKKTKERMQQVNDRYADEIRIINDYVSAF